MNALVCMQAKKRRLHAVPSCGSDRLKLHFREGSVAGISQMFRISGARRARMRAFGQLAMRKLKNVAAALA